jgi:anti-sigma B factor antagonist
MEFGLTDIERDGCHTLSLVGELDVATAPELQATVDRLCEEGAREIVLDLHEVSFIDSSGLRAILASRQRCARSGCDFSLTRAQPHAQHLFELTGLIGRLSFRGKSLARRLTGRETAAREIPVTRFRPDFEASLELNLDAPRAARNYVRELLGADAQSSLCESAMLLTSDLVSPIVRSGPSVFLEAGELRVWFHPEVVRVELEAPSELLAPAPEHRAPRYDQTLLNRLADRWSIDPDPPGSCVWFEIDRGDARGGEERQPVQAAWADSEQAS